MNNQDKFTIEIKELKNKIIFLESILMHELKQLKDSVKYNSHMILDLKERLLIGMKLLEDRFNHKLQGKDMVG